MALPLYGIPVAVKDNIDVKGLPTTAACPAFGYRPGKDATSVAKLRQAGALILGKTNLDQFATGLVGVRTPYGIARNLFDDKLIAGGSSTGSALAVAAGFAPLALGTDTAGSGRVPAAFSNIVGLKPSRGMVSCAGVVPACRTLDCVSVFALTVDDAMAMLNVIAGPDAADPYSHPRPVGAAGPMPDGVKLGVPLPGQRLFFGDTLSAKAYDEALARLTSLGAKIVEIDIEPFYAAARLLYDGPWVAERYLVAKALIASSPESLHPVTRQIILAGAHRTAADTFAAFYQLEELRRVAEHTFRTIDALVLPTAPTIYTVEQVLADPIQLNSRLGTYTNFVNLLDLCGLAVPSSMRADGVPFGITLLAPAGADAALAAIGRAISRRDELAARRAGARQISFRRVDHAHMGGDDAPAFGKAHPGLHLAADFARHGRAVIERRSDGVIAAVGADDGLRQRARQAGRRARGAECRDLGVAIKDLAAAVADGARIVAEYRVQGGDVVRHQGLFVTLEFGRDFGNDLRQVDLHKTLLEYFPQSAGRGAATTPCASSAWAMRNATSSRHGAAMICTAIGNGASGTGTATTGRPMNEIGWV